MTKRRPWVEILLAGLLACAVSFAAGAVLAGCADTGSRHSPHDVPPNSFRVRQITVIPPANANQIELAWIKETVREHLLLLDAIPLPTKTAIRLRVHRTLRDWQDAYQLVRNPKVGNDPVIWQPRLVMVPPLSQQLFVGPVEPAFLYGATLHVVAGTFFEGPSLAHHLVHIHLPALGVPSHVYGEPLWTSLDLAGWQLSQRLAAQR